jgi:hypothetical protein
MHAHHRTHCSNQSTNDRMVIIGKMCGNNKMICLSKIQLYLKAVTDWRALLTTRIVILTLTNKAMSKPRIRTQSRNPSPNWLRKNKNRQMQFRLKYSLLTIMKTMIIQVENKLLANKINKICNKNQKFWRRMSCNMELIKKIQGQTLCRITQGKWTKESLR